MLKIAFGIVIGFLIIEIGLPLLILVIGVMIEVFNALFNGEE